jgi:hypothetical protein
VGGFGSHVAQLSEEGVFDRGLRFRSMVLPDTFIDHASPRDMYARAGLNAEHIEAKVLEVLGVTVIGRRRERAPLRAGHDKPADERFPCSVSEAADRRSSERSDCLAALQLEFGLSDEEMQETIQSGQRKRVFDRAD